MAEPGPGWRSISGRLDNDFFAGTDNNYSHGLALALISHDIGGTRRPRCLPGPLNLYTRLLGRLDPGFWSDNGNDSATQNLVVRVGQSIYTPEDKESTELVADDRPYAGLLYLGAAWNRRLHRPESGYEMLDVRDVTLGLIGPWSLAERTQNLIHRIGALESFQGWSHQVQNEPAIQFTLERKFKPYFPAAYKPGWGSDVIGTYTVRVGNIETAVGGGVELRSGWNLPNDFGSHPIRPGAENRPPRAAAGQFRRTSTDRPQAAGVNAFVNLEAKAVAWNFSLDGNLFRDSHHVTRRPWVTQASAGISGQWTLAGHDFRLALMRVWRSREFEEQPGHHAFGSIALSMDF